MDTATLLRRSANLVAVAFLARVIAKDLVTEVRTDVVRSPYGSVGAATLLGAFAGMMLGRRHRRNVAGRV